MITSVDPDTKISAWSACRSGVVNAVVVVSGIELLQCTNGLGPVKERKIVLRNFFRRGCRPTRPRPPLRPLLHKFAVYRKGLCHRDRFVCRAISVCGCLYDFRGTKLCFGGEVILHKEKNSPLAVGRDGGGSAEERGRLCTRGCMCVWKRERERVGGFLCMQKSCWCGPTCKTRNNESQTGQRTGCLEIRFLFRSEAFLSLSPLSLTPLFVSPDLT